LPRVRGRPWITACAGITQGRLTRSRKAVSGPARSGVSLAFCESRLPNASAPTPWTKCNRPVNPAGTTHGRTGPPRASARYRPPPESRPSPPRPNVTPAPDVTPTPERHPRASGGPRSHTPVASHLRGIDAGRRRRKHLPAHPNGAAALTSRTSGGVARPRRPPRNVFDRAITPGACRPSALLGASCPRATESQSVFPTASRAAGGGHRVRTGRAPPSFPTCLAHKKARRASPAGPLEITSQCRSANCEPQSQHSYWMFSSTSAPDATPCITATSVMSLAATTASPSTPSVTSYRYALPPE